MATRRSESCPRLTRKEPSPQVAPSAPLALPQARNCTLQDLGPEDRQKVAKLLKQVVDLGQEVQQLKQQRDEQAQAFAQRETDLQEANRQLHREHQSLKKKLGQVLLVLRASQTKVNALEAAQAAARPVQCVAQVQTDPAPGGRGEGQTRGQGSSRRDASAAEDSGASEAERSAPTSASAVAPSGLRILPGPDSTTPVAQPGSELHASASALALPHPDVAAVLESKVLRSSLSAPAGLPHLLHVAPGAHINITINHAPEAAGGTAAAVVQQAGAQAPGHATGDKLPKQADCPDLALGGPVPQSSVLDRADGPSEATAGSRVAGAGEAVGALLGAPQGAAVIAIPTSTASVAVASVVASAASPGVGLLESAGDPESPSDARFRGRGNLPKPAPGAGSEAAPWKRPNESGAGMNRLSHPRNILVDATMQQYEAVPVHEVVPDSQEPPVASPMIVPPSEGVVAAATSLLDWQVQHGLISSGGGDARASLASAAHPPEGGWPGAKEQRMGRKVLSYDPAIGRNGAFYFLDVPEEQLEPPGPTVVSAARQGLRNSFASADITLGRGGLSGELVDAGASAPQDANRQGASHRADVLHPGADNTWPHTLGPNPAAPTLPQAPHTALQRPRQPSMRPPQPSPCLSASTESTAVMTPSLHPAAPHGMDTPCGSAVSLSRMAMVLDEVAWQQRWDLQPPSAVTQPQGPAGGAPHQGAARAMPQGGRCRPQQGASSATSDVRAPRNGSAGSGTGKSVFDLPVEAAALGTPSPSCGSSAVWAGASDVIERYDDSLVDILSQADEEMDQLQQHHHHHHHQPHALQQPNPGRQRLQAARGQPGVTGAAPPTARSSRGAMPVVDAQPRGKQKAASFEALLAANLYEENDVLSVILEQEDNG